MGGSTNPNSSKTYYVTDNVIDAFNYIESELYKENTHFYNAWLKYRNYLERKRPIIEDINKNKLKKL